MGAFAHTYTLTTHAPVQMVTGKGETLLVDSVAVGQLQMPLDFTTPTPAAPEPLTEPLPLLAGLCYLHEGYSVLGILHPKNTALVVRPKNAPTRPECATGTENDYYVPMGLDEHGAITALGCECRRWATKKPGTKPCRHGELVKAVCVWISALKHALPFLETYALSNCWARDGVELLEMVGPLGSAKFLVARMRGSKTVGVVVNDTPEALRWAQLGLLGEVVVEMGGQG